MVCFYPEIVAFTKESDNLYMMATNSELYIKLYKFEDSRN